MVDTGKALESEYVTAELVMNSPTKKAVFIDEGKYEQSDYGEKLTLHIGIDGKTKIYRPSKDTVHNLRAAYGVDSAQWVGKFVIFRIVRYKGKDVVLGDGVREMGATPSVTVQPRSAANFPIMDKLNTKFAF